jgi:hypothetical protein
MGLWSNIREKIQDGTSRRGDANTTDSVQTYLYNRQPTDTCVFNVNDLQVYD